MSDQQPICSVEAEAALLGALMTTDKLIDPVADSLSPADFFEPLHGRIFEMIVRQKSLGRSTSPVGLRQFFESDPEMAECGGPAYLAQLTGSGAAVVGARDFARQIRDFAQRRRPVASLQEAIGAAHDPETELGEVAELADNASACVRDLGEDAGSYSAAAALDLVINSFDEPVCGVLCGVIPAIDDLLGPMRHGHLVIGAGRPGMGKTATAISYALGAAARGHATLFVSKEMGALELAERMAADLCLEQRVPYSAIRDRSLAPSQRMAVARARERIDGLPLQILDKQGLSISQLRTLVRRWVRRFEAKGKKLELVVVDYLQLVRGDRKGMSEFEVVSEVSRTLKEIAKEFGLAVFALSQLSREVEKRADKRPQLSDLRQSGQIEQDADAVLFLLRDEFYLAQQDPTDEVERQAWESALEKCRGRIEFICAKRRNGASGSRMGLFHAPFQAVRS